MQEPKGQNLLFWQSKALPSWALKWPFRNKTMVPPVELPRFVEAAAGQYVTAKVRWPYTSVHYFPSEGIAEQQAELTCCTQREHYRGENEIWPFGEAAVSAEYLDQSRVKQPSSQMHQALTDKKKIYQRFLFCSSGSSFAIFLGPKHTKEGPLLAVILKMMTICP